MVTSCLARTALVSLLLTWPALAEESIAFEGQINKTEPSQAEIDEGQRHYKRGVELFRNTVYDAALIEFRRAYEIAPSYKILYNIGQVSRQLDDYASAVDAYQCYLRDGKGSVSAARETEVKAELEKIGQWVGKLEISSSSPDATIAVDDVSVGRGSMSSVLVNSGRRKVIATLVGQPMLTRVIDVAGGETVKLSFDFTSEKAQSSSFASTKTAREPQKPVEQKSESSEGRTYSTKVSVPSTPEANESTTHWWLWGGTAVLAAGAVTTGVFALSASNKIDDIKRGPSTNTSSYDDQHTRMSRLALTTDILTGLAVATGSVALYFTLKSPSGESNVGLAISPTGAVLSKSF